MAGSTLIILMSPSGNEVEVVCRLEVLDSAVEKRLLLLEKVFFSKGVVFVVVVVASINADEVWEKRMLQKMDNFMIFNLNVRVV